MLDSVSKEQCQHPERRSTVENTFALERSGRISSKIIIWCRSRWSEAQTLIPPDFLVAIATLLTGSVGSLTGVITPTFCNRSILSLNFNLGAAGTLREWVMTGRTSVLTSRWTSPADVPRGQLKTSRCFDRTCSVVDRTCNAGEVSLGSCGETIIVDGDDVHVLSSACTNYGW